MWLLNHYSKGDFNHFVDFKGGGKFSKAMQNTSYSPIFLPNTKRHDGSLKDDEQYFALAVAVPAQHLRRAPLSKPLYVFCRRPLLLVAQHR